MQTYEAVARDLGLGGQASAPVALSARIAAGLPLQALTRLTRDIAPGDATFKYRIVSRSSLARRAQAKRISREESERLVRLAKVWAAAKQAWGEAGEARAFLARPHAMLQDRLPLDVALESDVGAEAVRDILGRLTYGSAA